MRRRSLVTAIVLGLAGTAHAVDHGARINEVGLSKAGDQTVQFVEIIDTFGGETYPNGPYKLAFFDPAGASIGTTTLTLSGLHTKYYVATAAADTAYGTVHDDLLNVALPQNGQVCFQRGTGQNISCATWGCITTFVTVGEPRMPTPPDNMSGQRQSDGSFQIATPTPNATNIAGASMPACPTDPMDMPGLTNDTTIPHDASLGTDPGKMGGCCSASHDAPAGGSLLAGLVVVALRRRRATSSARCSERRA